MYDRLPEHIGIIPDGNRRWAKEKGLPRYMGHQAGADRMHQVLEALIPLGITHMTLWGFSADNWKREEEELNSIFELLELWIKKDAPWLHDNNVRLRHIGRIDELPQGLKAAIKSAVGMTGENTGMVLNLAFNYSGRTEIVDAMKRIIKDKVPVGDLDEVKVSQYLDTDGLPDVDLLIRTAGELRLSNFMLWQTAYSEYFFSELLWPDFDEKELKKALNSYAERSRRFGGD